MTDKQSKLNQLIEELQKNINDDKLITNINDIKMEIFKLWYFNRFGKEYGEQ